MKLDRFHERVLANALGFLNSAMRPLKGVARVQKYGFFARMLAVLTSFLPFMQRREPRSSAPRMPSRGCKRPNRYLNGYNKDKECARRMRQAKRGLITLWRQNKTGQLEQVPLSEI